ncbi:hypothetical protein EQG49_02500 [Periweissella cryptocerci]|uniref:Uncharacterized protein n=1 Tax=Periweissella cryptocerci TaxID=2506420 RepID=A0A4P6YS32_9LACO|nr:hypothetical protein [Periweissella cryptocerci]QBO35413.1 hypothetical protein EQG49_02500 [Periweissella cryptocerci]
MLENGMVLGHPISTGIATMVMPERPSINIWGNDRVAYRDEIDLSEFVVDTEETGQLIERDDLTAYLADLVRFDVVKPEEVVNMPDWIKSAETAKETLIWR